MNDWTLGSFLFALALVILGGAAVGFVARRTMFKNLRIEDPFVTFRRHERNKFRASLGVLAGLAAAMLIYPLSCRLDVDLNVLGLSDKALTFLLIFAFGMALPIYLVWRNKRR